MSKLVDLCNYFTKFDFVCLSETWLKEETSFVIDLPGYVHFSFVDPLLTAGLRGVQVDCYCTSRKSCKREYKCYPMARSRSLLYHNGVLIVSMCYVTLAPPRSGYQLHGYATVV